MPCKAIAASVKPIGSVRSDPKSIMDFPREATYPLSPKSGSDLGYGLEFENRRKN
jgi:hypothetical protein